MAAQQAGSGQQRVDAILLAGSRGKAHAGLQQDRGQSIGHGRVAPLQAQRAVMAGRPAQPDRVEVLCPVRFARLDSQELATSGHVFFGDAAFQRNGPADHAIDHGMEHQRPPRFRHEDIAAGQDGQFKATVEHADTALHAGEPLRTLQLRNPIARGPLYRHRFGDVTKPGRCRNDTYPPG